MSTVTVAIPTIPGREDLVERAVTSARCQLRQADAVIVEKDVWRTGAAATRNRLLAKIETDWIAWLDDDDELLSNHIRALMDIAEHNDVDLVYPRPALWPVDWPDVTATRNGSGLWVSPWGVPFGKYQRHQIRHETNFIPVTYLVRTEVARSAGGFPEPNSPDWAHEHEDWGFLVRLLDVGARFWHLDHPTWIWHHHDDHTGGEGEQGEALREHADPVVR